MTAHTFDSLAVARKLEDTGLNRAQAEAIAEELRAAVVAILAGLRF